MADRSSGNGALSSFTGQVSEEAPSDSNQALGLGYINVVADLLDAILGDGNEEIVTKNGANVFGTKSGDVIRVLADDVDVFAREGADDIKVNGSNFQIFGEEGPDRIVGVGSGVIKAGAARDVVIAKGSVKAFGGAAADILIGLGKATLSGGDDDDLLIGDDAPQVANGDRGNDRFELGAGFNETRHEGPDFGHDLIKAQSSAHTLRISEHRKQDMSVEYDGNSIILKSRIAAKRDARQFC